MTDMEINILLQFNEKKQLLLSQILLAIRYLLFQHLDEMDNLCSGFNNFIKSNHQAVLIFSTTLVLALCISTISVSQDVYVNINTGFDEDNNCANPGSPCATINHAIAEVQNWAVVHIANGVYTENVLLTKNITLSGENQDSTIIQANELPWQEGAGCVIGVFEGLVVNISDITIRNGHIDGDNETGGGGLGAQNIAITLSNVTFSENSANSSVGGGLNCYQCVILLQDVLFSNNEANSGGGMNVDVCSVDMYDVVFTGNRAITSGGGLRFVQGDSSLLENVDFIDNEASVGGGMYSDGSIHYISPAFHNVTFMNNFASDFGGGLWCDFNSSSVFSNVIFRGNEAGLYGGGISSKSGCNHTMVNMVFAGNKAGQYGGAMVTVGSDPLISNVTFTGNECVAEMGGALYVNNGTPVLQNVIMWNNSSFGSTSPPDASVFKLGTDTPHFLNSLIANSGGSDDWDSFIGVNLGNNIDADPQFLEELEPATAPSTAGNFHLLNTSPAIDAGHPDSDLDLFPGGPDNPLDIDGNGRVHNGIIDLGAYEWNPMLSISSSNRTIIDLLIFPNPAVNWLQIDYKDGIDRVEVYSATGKEVMQHEVQAYSFKMDVSNLSKGIYLVNVYSGLETGVYQFIKH